MKPAFKTTEFWMTIAAVVAKAYVPDLPDEVIYGVGAYVLARTGQKGATSIAKSREEHARIDARAAQEASADEIGWRARAEAAEAELARVHGR